MLTKLYSALLELVFPSHCPSCHAYTEAPGQWCEDCLTDIIRNKNLSYDEHIRQLISPIITIGKYDKGLRHLLHELKYEGDKSVEKYLPPLFAALEAEWDFKHFDYIIPVPLHTEKLAKRGYNQVDIIFAPWAKQQGYTYVQALQRTRYTEKQFLLNHQERYANLTHAFTMLPGIDVKGANCLLVDDIFTTGSTLGHCARILRKHGAKAVSGLVLASNADD